MDRLSHSQLNGWANCSEQYRLERIVRVPQIPAWYLIGGNAVHEATEHHDLREHGVAVPHQSFEEIFERLTSEKEEETGFARTEFRAGGRSSRQWPDKENASWWLAEGPGMVNRWINWTRSTPWQLWITPNGKPAVELEFNLVLDEVGVTVKGFIDRVFQDPATGSLIVFDLKTGSGKQASARQLGTYKIGVLDKWPDLDIGWGTFWSARTGVTESVSSLDPYSRERLAWQFNVVKEARRQNLYLANPGRMCNSCSVQPYCYETQGELSGEVPKPWEAPAGEGVRVELAMEGT